MESLSDIETHLVQKVRSVSVLIKELLEAMVVNDHLFFRSKEEMNVRHS